MQLHRFIQAVSDCNKVRHALKLGPLDVPGMMALAREHGITILHESVAKDCSHRDRPDCLHVEMCINCGVRFGIDADYWLRSLVNHAGGAPAPEGFDGEGWYCCPDGCRQRVSMPACVALGDCVVALARKLEVAEARLTEKA